MLACSELTERDVTGAVGMAGGPLVRFAHIDEQGTGDLAAERFVCVDFGRLRGGGGSIAEQEHSEGLLRV